MPCLSQKAIIKVFALSLSLMITGCASTKVVVTGNSSTATICQAQNESLSALVLWRTKWRPEQKDRQLREEAARLGLQDFLSTSNCFTSHQLKRIQEGNYNSVLPDSELLALAASIQPKPHKVLLVTVRELGPTVKLFSSAALLEGGTEVNLDLTVLDIYAQTSIAKVQAHWQHGGAFVLKGVDSLPQDMSAALRVAVSLPHRAP